MIIKTLLLAGFMLASALASEGEENKPYPAALLVQSNFDFSLIRKEFRVHYGGSKAESNPTKVSIKLYKPDGSEAHTYNLEKAEMKERNAFHFALDDVTDGKYEVEVCEGSGEDSVCSAKTPSLTDVKSSKHKLFCKEKVSGQQIEIDFVEPTTGDWAVSSNYTEFSKTINKARAAAGAPEDYKTDFEKHEMKENPYYEKTKKIFSAAIMHDLRRYRQFFDTKANDYCKRKYMLSLHSHIVDVKTKKVIHRFKTVNHLSEAGKRLFILEEGGEILLESTHENVVIPNGNYKVWVSLCVTDKDTIESTYCANPITKDLTVKDK